MRVYGKNVAKEILQKPQTIKKAYIYEKFNDEEILNKLKNSHIPYEFLDKNIIVILDHLEDPHNFGAIIRTCEAAGITSIIIPKDRSVKVNATVMKTSAGALENVNVCMVTNLVNTIKKLKENGYWIIGTDMEGKDYRQIDYEGKIAIIIGSEGKGLSRLTEENCDFIAKIPMYGKVNSLNASVAAALIIYEAVRNK